MPLRPLSWQSKRKTERQTQAIDAWPDSSKAEKAYSILDQSALRFTANGKPSADDPALLMRVHTRGR
jgi:hypothetical protein